MPTPPSPALPAPKIIQEAFGQTIIDAVAEFARKDLESVAVIEASHLAHIDDPAFRKTLAETLYGARWIYKLGLALLVKDEEQMAHVRAQLIDYSSVAEGVLSDVILSGITRSKMTGSKYRYKDVVHLQQEIFWNRGRERLLIEKQSFHWLISVAEEEKMISTRSAINMDKLRLERNSVHLRARTYKAFLGKSMKAYQQLHWLFDDTRKWKEKNK